jgi:hypothetical protein
MDDPEKLLTSPQELSLEEWNVIFSQGSGNVFTAAAVIQYQKNQER